MSLWAKQATIRVKVKRICPPEDLLPNPKHTGVFIRGLPDNREPLMDKFYEDTLASLLDATILESDFQMLTTEEIEILKQWHTDNARLLHAVECFLSRFQ